HCLYEETEIGNYQAANDPKRPLDRLTTSEQKQTLADVCRKIKEAVVTGVDVDSEILKKLHRGSLPVSSPPEKHITPKQLLHRLRRACTSDAELIEFWIELDQSPQSLQQRKSAVGGD